jgi:hypothetical protein
MPQRAQVTSIEAIEAFRASLIVYLAKARALLEGVDDEKQQTKSWIDHDRRTHWEQECRRRGRQLEEAEQELFSARVSHLRTQSAAQLLAVERAKQALRQAEGKRDLVKRWSREYDNRVDPLAKQLDQLHTFLTTDLAKAVVYLGNVLKALEAYTAAGGLERPGAAVTATTINPPAEANDIEQVTPAEIEPLPEAEGPSS